MALPPPLRVGQIHRATDGRDILVNDPDGWEVDRQYLWWDGPAGSDGTGGPYGNPPPDAQMLTPGWSGTSLGAYGFCDSLVSESIGSMPWKVYRGRQQLDTPSWIADPQNLALDGRRADIGNDMVRMSAVEFWSQAIRSYNTWGESIIYTPRIRDEFGDPTGPIVAPIYNLHPGHVEFDAGRYLVTDPDTGDEQPLDARELIVTRNIVRPGRKRALGYVQAYAYELGMAGKIRGYTDNTFQRGVPSGFLTVDTPDFNDEAAAKLKRSWLAAHGGTRRSIAVLNATTHFQALNLDPQVGSIIDMLKLSAWEIAMMFKVPPSQLSISMGDTGTYRNLEADNTVLVQRAFMLPARKFEASISAVLPGGTSLKIDFRQLLRADAKTRMDIYKAGIESGVYTVDEVREFEDLPPLPDTPDPVEPSRTEN